MIIAFLGKGGSGKSTVSTNFVRHQHVAGKRVLAIDVDHNMDMAYQLAGDMELRYFGGVMHDLMQRLAIAHWKDVYTQKSLPSFLMNAEDTFLTLAENQLEERLSLLVAGPHTPEVLAGTMCSHGLATPLKVFLPLLQLQEGEVVVLDEKAGVDGIGTGIPTGAHLICIVTEPTTASTKATCQIREVVRHFDIDYVIVGNKIREDADLQFIEAQTGERPLTCLPFSSDRIDTRTFAEQEAFDHIEAYATELLKQKGDMRLQRTLQKVGISANHLH